MSEKWREIYDEKQLRRLQQLELLNLKELQRVCEALGIEFILYGGSLIGAVRHGGFVPWDDDLDVAMMREDYEKFIKEAPKLLGEDFFLQHYTTDKKTPYFYAKLRLKGTKCVEYGNHRLRIDHGIYVDIYPIDKMHAGSKQRLETHRKYQKLSRLYILRQTPFRACPSKGIKDKLRAVARFAVSTALHVIPMSYFVKKMNSYLTIAEDEDTNIYGNYFYPKPSPTNLFFGDPRPFVRGTFEGVNVKLPLGYHEHLTSRYGNYLELPPEEKRIGHLPYKLDFGKYKED